MHFIVFMREVPPTWKRCPNRNIADPSRRINQRCLEAESLWPWGWCDFRYFRHSQDPWAPLGFVTPAHKETLAAIPIHGPRSAGAYVGKYLNKEDKPWKYRTKNSRGFGLDRLKNHLQSLRLELLHALTWRPLKHSSHLSVTMTHIVPSAVLRSLAKSILFSRQWAEEALDMEMWMQPNSHAYPKMLKSVRAGQKPHRMDSADFYDWVGQHLPAPHGYCDHTLDLAHSTLAFGWSRYRTTPASKISGLRHGYT